MIIAGIILATCVLGLAWHSYTLRNTLQAYRDFTARDLLTAKEAIKALQQQVDSITLSQDELKQRTETAINYVENRKAMSERRNIMAGRNKARLQSDQN